MISFGCFRLVFGCYLGGGASRVGVTGRILAISLFVDEELVVMSMMSMIRSIDTENCIF